MSRKQDDYCNNIDILNNEIEEMKVSPNTIKINFMNEKHYFKHYEYYAKAKHEQQEKTIQHLTSKITSLVRMVLIESMESKDEIFSCLSF